jgi:hypothetical protein
MRPRGADELLSEHYVFNHHRHIRFALDSEARIEQIGTRRGKIQFATVTPSIGKLSAGRGRDNARRVSELRPVERQNVLQDKLARIPACSVIVLFDIEAHHVIPFRQEAFSPSPEPAKQIYAKRFHGFLS